MDRSWPERYPPTPGRVAILRDHASRRDPAAGGTERLPARAGGQGRGRRRAAPDLVWPSRARAPRPRPPRRGRPDRRLARCGRSRSRLGPPPPRDHDEGARGRRPSVVGSRPLDPHLAVDRRRASPAHRRGGLRPRRPRRDARPAGTPDRRPGAPARPTRRRRIAAPAAPPPWIRDADRRMPTVSISGTNGKTTATRLITRILPAPAATSGRRPRTASSSTSAWSSPATGRVPAAPAVLERRDVDVAVLETARGGLVLQGVGYESNDASILTNVTSDHLDLQGIHTLPELAEVKATICRITKPDGWVDPQRRRPASSRRSPARSARRSPSSPSSATVCRRVRRHLARGGRAYLVRDGTARRGGRRGRAGQPDRRRPRDPDHARRPRPPQRGQCAGRGRRGARRSARRSRRSATACSTSGPRPSTRPGRLNIFRLGARVVIVDFAHNEAGLWPSSTSPRASPPEPPAG